MENSTLLQRNVTQLSITNKIISTYIHLTFIFLITVCFCFFVYFMVLMFSVFFKSPPLRENARYVLFVYMLVNDMVYISLGFALMLGAIYKLYVPVPICYILYTVSAVAYRATPSTLAAMALEKYVAICHPLRYPELCTPQRAHAAFSFICVVLLIPYAAELGLMASSFTNIFNLYIICRQEMLLVNPYQTVLRSLILISCFVWVAIVILFTYMKIMAVASRVSSQSSTASKAKKTVMFHAFQLLLCTSSLLSVLPDVLPSKPVEFLTIVNFLVFTCIPRFLSPVIYGIRDEHLRKCIIKSLPKCSKH